MESRGGPSEPPNPPLPVDISLWFHASARGSHTSTSICEAGVGVSVACTRQKALAVGRAGIPKPLISTGAPAAKDRASVIVASFTRALARSSQVAAWAPVAARARAAPMARGAVARAAVIGLLLASSDHGAGVVRRERRT